MYSYSQDLFFHMYSYSRTSHCVSKPNSSCIKNELVRIYPEAIIL
jgi:hypothetical protein